MRNLLLISAIIGLSLIPSRSFAQNDAGQRRALWEKGTAAMRAKNWTEAEHLLGVLWQEQKSYDVALNLGQAEYSQKKYRDAAEHLAFGIRTFPPREPVETVERAKQKLEEAKKHVGTITVSIDRGGADVLVDGQLAGTAPLPDPLFTEPGSHTLEAHTADHAVAHESVDVKAGEVKYVALTLSGASSASSAPSPAPSPAPPAAPSTVPVNGGLDARQAAPSPPPSPVAPQDSSVEPRTIALWSGVGLTVVAAGVGTAFALHGSSKGSDVDRLKGQAQAQLGENCAPGSNVPVCSQLTAAASARNTADQRATVMFVTAGVFALGTVATFFLWPAQASAGHVQVEPSVGPQGGALTLKGVF